MSIDTPANPPVDAFEAALATPEVVAEPIQAEQVEAIVEAPVVEAAVEAPVEENDENSEFRAALRNAPGEWFVVHSYAGYEKKVKANLANRIQSLNMEDYVYQIEVPEEEVRELKNGAIKVVKRNGFPGYVLVLSLIHICCFGFRWFRNISCIHHRFCFNQSRILGIWLRRNNVNRYSCKSTCGCI